MKYRVGLTAVLLFVSMKSLAVEVTTAELEAAKRLSQQAVQDARLAYQAQMAQKANNHSLPSVNLTQLPTPQASLANLQGWVRQAQSTQLLAGQEHPVKGIVFVSFSMPEQAIKNYLMQVARIHGGRSIKLSIRGLDESNSLIKTQQRISKLMTGMGAEVDIDPGAFERFNVQQVPAMVFYKDDPLGEAQCAIKGEKSNHQTDYLMVYGDVSIDYAIDHLLKDKSAKQWQNELTAMRDAVVGKL